MANSEGYRAQAEAAERAAAAAPAGALRAEFLKIAVGWRVLETNAKRRENRT